MASWRLNKILIKDGPTCAAVISKVSHNSARNQMGGLISEGSRLEKERSSDITQLLQEDYMLELAHKRTLEFDLFQPLERKCKDLHQFLDQVHFQHKDCIRRTMYEVGNNF